MKEMDIRKRIFSIEWEEDCGPMWMNVDNLLTCLNTKEHCGEGLILEVEDLTEHLSFLEKLQDIVYKMLAKKK